MSRALLLALCACGGGNDLGAWGFDLYADTSCDEPGAMRCSGSRIQQCEAGSWVTIYDCRESGGTYVCGRAPEVTCVPGGDSYDGDPCIARQCPPPASDSGDPPPD